MTFRSPSGSRCLPGLFSLLLTCVASMSWADDTTTPVWPFQQALSQTQQAVEQGRTIIEGRLLSAGAKEEFSLLEAALVAGGARDGREVSRFRRMCDKWLADLRPQAAVAGDVRKRGKKVLEFMHQHILKGQYDRQCSSLAVSLDQGRFNCVSATVLFCVLARGCDLQVQVVGLPTHVFCRLQHGSTWHDVQTTDAEWFERPISSVVNVASAAKERTLQDLELIALIYYNQGVELLQNQQFAPALEANWKALRLDPAHPSARENVLAAYNNWAIDLASTGDFPQALSLLAAARRFDPQHAPFRRNMATLYQCWAAEQTQPKQAEEILQQGLQALPNEPALELAKQAIEQKQNNNP